MTNLKTKTKAELIAMIEEMELTKFDLPEFVRIFKSYIQQFQVGMLSKEEINSAIDLVVEYYEGNQG